MNGIERLNGYKRIITINLRLIDKLHNYNADLSTLLSLEELSTIRHLLSLDIENAENQIQLIKGNR